MLSNRDYKQYHNLKIGFNIKNSILPCTVKVPNISRAGTRGQNDERRGEDGAHTSHTVNFCWGSKLRTVAAPKTYLFKMTECA